MILKEDTETQLFNSMNYQTLSLEIKNKTHWNDNEVIKFLKNDIPIELVYDEGELKYDGLIVCISWSQGLKLKLSYQMTKIKH